jgi:hypothetical protein
MTYDPVNVIERPKTRMFGGLPSAAPGTVLVVDREGHPVRVLATSQDRLTAGEVRWGQIRTLYEVDITEHPLEFRATFPCSDDIGGFRALVQLSCAVIDAADVVMRGIRDVARVLFPPVTETLRRVCSQFPAENYQEAEAAGLNAIRRLETGPGHDPAFRISRIHLVLDLDDAAASYVRGRKETTRNLTRQEDAARLEREKSRLEAELTHATGQFDQQRLVMQRDRERLEAELADQRQQLELERAAARARSEQQTAGDLELERLRFERQRQAMQAELDRQKLELELGRAELQAQYDMKVLDARLVRDQKHVAQLTELLSRGQYAALAMQLAQDPDAIGPVSAYLADQRAADTNRQLQALKLLVENDGLEGWQITDQAKAVLRQLIATWSAGSGQIGSPESTPEIEAGSAADQPQGAPRAPAPPEPYDGEYPGDREPRDGGDPAGPAGPGAGPAGPGA